VLDGPAMQALTRYQLDESPTEPPEGPSIARPPVGEPSQEPSGPAPDPNPGLDGFK
jgi:hypothetical protein